MRSVNSIKGFTLIEMVIAVAIMAILSIGILKLFIAAEVNHQKALDIDHAVFESCMLIENNRNSEIPKNGVHKTIYYDEKWEKMIKESGDSQYAIYIDILPLDENKGMLFSIHLKVVRIKPYPLEINGEQEIYSISNVF